MLLLVGVLPSALVSSGLSLLWIILLLRESFLTSLTVGMDIKWRLHKTNLILKQRLASFIPLLCWGSWSVLEKQTHYAHDFAITKDQSKLWIRVNLELALNSVAWADLQSKLQNSLPPNRCIKVGWRLPVVSSLQHWLPNHKSQQQTAGNTSPEHLVHASFTTNSCKSSPTKMQVKPPHPPTEILTIW